MGGEKELVIPPQKKETSKCAILKAETQEKEVLRLLWGPMRLLWLCSENLPSAWEESSG